LPSGSYIPHFNKPAPLIATPATPESPQEEVTAPLLASTEPPSTHSGTFISKKLLGATIALGLVVISAALWQRFRTSPLDDFWRPFISSEAPVLFCIADQSHFSTITLRDASDPQRQNVLTDRMITVIIDDVSPLVDIAGMLQVRGKAYKVKGEAATTLTDLREGPNVFIGAFDNNWTLRTTGPLRFHFANNPDMSKFWIEDREGPSHQTWLVDRTVQQSSSWKSNELSLKIRPGNHQAGSPAKARESFPAF
jgi:hypothetical protein